MALVPLEQRLESKERAWDAERRELVVRSEEGAKALKAAEERCADLDRRRGEAAEGR